MGQILNYETKISIEKNRKKITVKTLQIQINNKEENWLSKIEIKHDPRQNFTLNFARIVDSAGNILRKLKQKEIFTRNDLTYQAFYQDDLITEFELYWNQYPYQIEYSYKTVEEEYLYVTWWTPIVFSSVATQNSTLSISVPSEYLISVNQSKNLSYDETLLEDVKILKWKLGTVKAPEMEIYSPHIREIIPSVSVIPNNFKYGIDGWFDSWSTFGNWLEKLNRGSYKLPVTESTIVDEFVQSLDNKEEIVKKLYYYLQDHTKYINVAIDVGGLKSYPASYVSQNKYGDCKALTTYIKSMLKRAGIESEYSVINAGLNSAKINEDFPSQQFNHVILTIPLDNDTIWLENTSNSLPFNYLGTFTQDRFALAVNGEKSKLIRTPKLNVSDVAVHRTYIFDSDQNDLWQCYILLDLRGKSFEEFRYNLSNRSKEHQDKQVLDQIDIEKFELYKWSLIDFNRDHTNLEVNVTGGCPNPIREIGRWQVIHPLRIIIPDFESPPERELDVRINFPISQTDKAIYKIQNLDKYEIQLPKSINLKSEYGEYSASYFITGKGVEVNEKFTLYDGDISLQEYPIFYSFIKSILDYKKRSTILIQ